MTTAPNGATNENSYDKKGNRTGSKNALGHQSKTLTFDNAGRALKTQDANGSITESKYDTAGRMVKTSSNGQTTTYEYDRVGRQIKITYPSGSSNQNEYDSATPPKAPSTAMATKLVIKSPTTKAKSYSPANPSTTTKTNSPKASMPIKMKPPTNTTKTATK